MKYKLENTTAEIMEREKVTRKQENQIKQLKEQVAVNERKMDSYDQKNAVLKVQNEANNTSDFSRQEKDLKNSIDNKEMQIKRLVHAIQG